MSVRRWASLCCAAGLAVAFVALIDPARSEMRPWGVALCALGLCLARPLAARLVAAVAIAFAAASSATPHYGADSVAYFAPLRSVFFDADLDYTNEWRGWGYEPPPMTATGLRQSAHSVGPALVWAPFFAAAHGYVRLDNSWGSARYAADGFSQPYLRSTWAGTLAAVIVGSWLLALAGGRIAGPQAGALGALAAMAASPVLYYAWLAPMMAHGVEFGIAAALLWAVLRARDRTDGLAWLLVGALFGLLVMVRWQALVLLVCVAPLALAAWRRRQLSMRWLAAAAMLALVVFLPQMLVWRALFGRLLTMPQGAGYMDWSSPHLGDVLLSANHGLFSWTPLMLAGFLGFFAGLRRERILCATAIVAVLATAWVNGSVADWAASDAFGGRRFCLVVPLLGVGVAFAAEAVAGFTRRHPIWVPASLVCAGVVWNVGFAGLYLERRYPDAAPIERLAADQARLARETAQAWSGALFGRRGKALAYRALSGEYLFTSFNTTGTLDLAAIEESELRGRWSPRRRPAEGRAFRWAVGKESCVRIPLQGPFELRAVVTARAPDTLLPQSLLASFNGQPVGARSLSARWEDVELPVPVRFQESGDNWLCLSFSNPNPENDGPHAAVSRVQILAFGGS
jgi:hypothetical protein